MASSREVSGLPSGVHVGGEPAAFVVLVSRVHPIGVGLTRLGVFLYESQCALEVRGDFPGSRRRDEDGLFQIAVAHFPRQGIVMQ